LIQRDLPVQGLPGGEQGLGLGHGPACPSPVWRVGVVPLGEKVLCFLPPRLGGAAVQVVLTQDGSAADLVAKYRCAAAGQLPGGCPHTTHNNAPRGLGRAGQGTASDPTLQHGLARTLCASLHLVNTQGPDSLSRLRNPCRPPCPVVVVSPNEQALRACALYFGLYPCKVDSFNDADPSKSVTAGTCRALYTLVACCACCGVLEALQ